MITYTKGDIFESDIAVIIHSCNAQGKYNAGFAKQMRSRHPKAYTAYMDAWKNGFKLGDVIWAESNDKLIGNLIGQMYYGRELKRYVSYDALSLGFASVNRIMKFADDKRVAMPLIGANLGGGSWKIISAIIETEMVDCEPVVYTLDGLIPQ